MLMRPLLFLVLLEYGEVKMTCICSDKTTRGCAVWHSPWYMQCPASSIVRLASPLHQPHHADADLVQQIQRHCHDYERH